MGKTISQVLADIASIQTLIPIDTISEFLGVYSAKIYTTGGTGTEEDPWVGWDTELSWLADRHYHFPAGWYQFDTPPDWAQQGLKITGTAGTFLKFTGEGKALSFIGETQESGASGPSFMLVENLTVVGTADCTHGVYAEAVHRSTWRNITVKNCTEAAFEFHFTILPVWDRLKHSYFGDINPVHAFVTDQRGSGEPVQAGRLLDPVLEGVTGAAVVLDHAFLLKIVGGTVEGNDGNGIVINSSCVGVTVDNTDLEANGGDDDLIDNGLKTVLKNILSNKRVTIGASSRFAEIDGGIFQSFTFTAGMKCPTVKNFPAVSVNGTGTGTVTVVPGVDGISGFVDYDTGATVSHFRIFPTLSNSWVDDPYVSYRKCAGQTKLEGCIKSGTIGAVAFNVPADYRPARTLRFRCSSGASGSPADADVQVEANGDVTILAGDNSHVFLDGIEWAAYLA